MYGVRDVSVSETFFGILRNKPVIAALRQPAHIEAALELGAEVVFLLNGSVFDLEAVIDAAARKRPDRRTLIFCHIDLLQGIGRDEAGLRFLAHRIGVDGILTTRVQLVRAAQQEGLFAVQRVFLVDSSAIDTAVNVLSKSKPDAIEILPALALPAVWRRLPVEQLPPIIAGGLVQTEDDLRSVLRTPVRAVSTSQPSLWSFRRS